MGIKRTPTGRIYYDAGDERQAQMVGLLGQLGDRLKRSEQEREELWKEMQEYRKLISDIEDKAATSEKVFLNIQGKLSRTEKLESEILKRQELLEKNQQEHFRKYGDGSKSYDEVVRRLEESETLTAALAEKLESSESQQKRLDRRIEKITQDRMRIARKLERMEETLLETQDVLRARALVLLTDQSLAAQTALPQLPAEIKPGQQDAPANDSQAYAWWKQFMQPQTVSTTFLMVLALLLGWSISEWQTSRIPSVAVLEDGRLARLEYNSAQAIQDKVAPEADETKVAGAVMPEDRRSLAKAPAADEVLPAVTGEYDLEAGNESGKLAAEPLNTGDYDDEALLEEMLEDPDAVAAKLNAIEPSASSVAGSIEKALEPALPEKARSESRQAAYTPSAGQVSGLNPDPSLPEPVKKIEKQAFEGGASAQHDLAAIYTAGYGGVKQNYEKASFWFRKAADQGVANACYNLGVLYHQGLGVNQNIDEAIKWYKEAASLGHPEAQYNLGIAYIEGIGVSYDPQKAADYFEKAASQQIMEAAYNLGLIHENGLLGKLSQEEALLWYKTAADWGSAEARGAMEQLAKSLNIKPEEIDRLVDLANAKKPAGKTGAGNSNDLHKKKPVVPAGQAVVAQIQAQLMDLGLYPGPADGAFGPLTRDAIRTYQRMNGLGINGEANEDLLIHMLARNLEEGAAGEVGSREQ